MNQEILEKYIISKCDFNATNDSFINNYINYPFNFENRIIDLTQEGIIDINYLNNYLEIKSLYIKYVNMKITFFDIKKSNKIEHIEIANLIDVDSNELKMKLDNEIKELKRLNDI